MNAIITFLKKPIVQAVCIGAFGGMSPKLIELVPRLFANVFPSVGTLLGLFLLAVIGGIVVRVYKELDLKKALVLGAGAPAILATLTAQAVVPNIQSLVLPISASIMSSAFAQSAGEMTVRIVVTKNESPYALNSLWIRADSKTISVYSIQGDTLLVSIPKSTNELRFDFPDQNSGLAVPISETFKTNVMRISITNNKQTKDFWETFGNKRLSQYKIELLQ